VNHSAVKYRITTQTIRNMKEEDMNNEKSRVSKTEADYWPKDHVIG